MRDCNVILTSPAPPCLRLNPSVAPVALNLRTRLERSRQWFREVHVPVADWQTSVVHGLLSWHWTVDTVWQSPVDVLQASAVHASASLQMRVDVVSQSPVA